MRRQHGGERPPGTTASGKLARAAVLTAPGTLEIQEFPLRAIRADEILVKVEACGVCGTDLADHAPFSPRSNRRGLSCEPSAGRHKGSRQSMSRCGLVQPRRALADDAAHATHQPPPSEASAKEGQGSGHPLGALPRRGHQGGWGAVFSDNSALLIKRRITTFLTGPFEGSKAIFVRRFTITSSQHGKHFCPPQWYHR